MIYENVELFNVSEITPTDDGGIHMHRFPLDVEADFGNQGKKMNVSATGVEIRFRMTDGPVTVRLRMEDPNAIGTVCIYQGSILRDWANCKRTVFGNRVTEVTVVPEADLSRLSEIHHSGQFPFDPALVRVVLNFGQMRLYGIEGNCTPPLPTDLPSRTLLAYGSSITHGSSALLAPNTFASVTAEELRLGLCNLGMAGSCRLEPKVADHIAKMGADGLWELATLCLGINVLSWDAEKIEERVSYMIKTVADANPHKHIFCISPMFSGADIKGEESPNRWRSIIERLVGEYGSPYVHYVNGLSLLDGAWGLSGDRVHPSPLGVRHIAERLIQIIRPYLS